MFFGGSDMLEDGGGLELRLAEIIEEQDAELRKLRSMCKAAAEEIASAWEAHCDEEGCGPVNLMARLEGKLPPDLYPAFDDQ